MLLIVRPNAAHLINGGQYTAQRGGHRVRKFQGEGVYETFNQCTAKQIRLGSPVVFTWVVPNLLFYI